MKLNFEQLGSVKKPAAIYIPHDPKGIFSAENKFMTATLKSSDDEAAIFELHGDLIKISRDEWKKYIEAYLNVDEARHQCRCKHLYFQKMHGHAQT